MATHNIHVEITNKVIDPLKIMRWLPDPAHGAEVLFLGMVRNHNQGRVVRAVSYDVFGPLAEKAFLEICTEAQAEAHAELGDDARVLLIHRSGTLQIGEVSVAIVVGSRHREAAFRASRYVIEQLKLRAPIWKKEHYEDGESEWLRGHALCGDSEHDHRSCAGGRSVEADGP